MSPLLPSLLLSRHNSRPALRGVSQCLYLSRMESPAQGPAITTTTTTHRPNPEAEVNPATTRPRSISNWRRPCTPSSSRSWPAATAQVSGRTGAICWRWTIPRTRRTRPQSPCWPRTITHRRTIAKCCSSRATMRSCPTVWQWPTATRTTSCRAATSSSAAATYRSKVGPGKIGFTELI